MSKLINRIYLMLLLILSTSVILTAYSFNSNAFSATSSTVTNCGEANANFFEIHPWYRGVTQNIDGKCVVVIEKTTGDNDIGIFIYKIGLNVIEIALKLVGYISAIYLTYGGFIYLTSNGLPDKVKKGQQIITNAAIGLVIALSSVAITNKLFEIAKGPPKSASALKVLSDAFDIAYWAAGAVAVVSLILAGIKLISSNGNPERMAAGKRSITYSIAGLIIIIIAFTITNFIIGKLS